MRGILTALAALALALLAGLAPSPVTATDGDIGVQRLTQAEWAYGDGPQAPAQGWRPAALPELFVGASRPSAERIGWYRLAFDLPRVPEQPPVLLVHRVVTTAEFRINGSLLNPGVQFPLGDTHSGTQMINDPQWLVVPSAVLRPGRNELLVRLAGDPVTPPWISGIAIGPADALRGEYQLRHTVQRAIPETLAWLMLAVLLVGLRLWWRERHPLQGQIVLVTALWLASLVLYLFPDAVPHRRTMQGLFMGLWTAFHWVLLHLLWRLAGRPWRWFPRVLAWSSMITLALVAVTLLVDTPRGLRGGLMLPTALLRVAITVMLLQWALRERTWAALCLTAAEVLWFAGPLQLMLVLLDLIPPDPFILSPGSAMPLFIVLLWLGTQRLAQQREHAALEREAAVRGERQRMMLDMHDGIGGQLATAVRLARREDVPREQVAQAVQDALQDLRLVIDSLDPGVERLPPLLGLLRDRIEPRLRALDQRLEWHVDEVPDHPPLSPTAALDVLRIVQEALNNALRHGGGTALAIALRVAPGGCELSIRDDGKGIDPALAAVPGSARGRGMASMQQRAARLGGRLRIAPDVRHGTVVSLWLPGTVGAP